MNIEKVESYGAGCFGLGVGLTDITDVLNLLLVALSLILVAYRLYHDVKKKGKPE